MAAWIVQNNVIKTFSFSITKHKLFIKTKLLNVHTGSLLYRGCKTFSSADKNLTLSFASLTRSVILMSRSRQTCTCT